jgi:NAD-dependent deacetylase
MQVPVDLVDRLARSRHVCVLTGAGISAESGIPTFRDAQQGLWARFRPEDLASRAGFEADPRRVWQWYQWRRSLVRRAEPNAGHRAIVDLARLVPRLTLVTQNVDGLHQRAGSADAIEFHGNLFTNACLDDGRPVRDVPDDVPEPQRCPRCGGWVRPGVVWFGEAIPREALAAALAAAEGCDVFFSVGTSSQVWPAAGLAEAAQDSGAMIVEINPQSTGLTSMADHVLAESASAALPKIVDALRLHTAH